MLCLLLAATTALAYPNFDILKPKLLQAMRAYNVPVVSYAIIKNNQIVAAAALSIDPKLKVNKNSLLQAASISKSVSAYGALKLVNLGKFDLADSVNTHLSRWQIPSNVFTQQQPVLICQLLDMTSGLSVSGFPGHSIGDTLPSLLQILNGKPPANTPPIRVFYQPGTKYFYSGGAFQVLELLIEDVTEQPFAKWMQQQILQPLAMHNSIYQYPLSSNLRRKTVPGFLINGKMIAGGWNNYAIAAAGGLWSTPTDLAKFAINIANAYLGKDNHIISQLLAHQMLTRQKNTDYGLGVVVNGSGNNLNFRKAGHNLGYHSQLIMFPNSGDGLVIMTNSENGEYVINYFIALVAQHYHWPCYFTFFDELISIPETTC